MSNLYSVIPALTPSPNEVMEAELLAKQILEAEFPNLDLREGTGLRDLVLRPTAYAMALLKKSTDYYFAQNTLSGLTDDTNEEIVDDILSNWFMTRSTGSYSIINVRLYFARQKNVSIPSSAYFSTDGNLKFFPSQTDTFNATALTYDAFQNEWYVDVQMTAESPGIDYNLGEGSLLYFSNFDPYFLHAEINYLAQSSTDPETNTEFLARSKNAISTRNLINNPSVISNLQETFNVLPRISVVGMGDVDMIRDQIPVIIEVETPRLLTEIVAVGNLATATLAGHGFGVGREIEISGAVPSGYNGVFTITSVTSTTFSFTLGSSPAVVSVLPTVQATESRALVHIGGKVDVYCGDDVSTSLVQVTTDGSGRAEITGPVLSITRSQITGGDEEDTIPYDQTVNFTSAVYHSMGILIYNASGVTLNGDDLLSVQGYVQTMPITSLSCSNLLVTANVPVHGLTTGFTVEITNVTPSGYNGTYEITVLDANHFTYSVSANILFDGAPVSGAMTLNNPNLDGDFSIALLGGGDLTIIIPQIWTSVNAVSNTTSVALSKKVEYSLSLPHRQTKTISAITYSNPPDWTTSEALATCIGHGYTAGRYITVAGASPSAYNGQVKVLEIVSESQFTYDLGAIVISNASGTITSTSVIPWEDNAFSTRQAVYVDFGNDYLYKTASFEVEYFTHVDSVQAHLDTKDVHVLCGDYLARGFNVYMLDVDAVIYNLASPSTDLVKTTLNNYVKSLTPGATLVLSDFVAQLSSAGVTNLKTPMQVDYTYYHRDWITPKQGSIVDYLDPEDLTSIFIIRDVTVRSEVV